QGIFLPPSHRKKFGGLSILLASLLSAVLSLLQNRVARNALWRLLCSGVFQKPVIDSQRLGFVLGINQQIKKHSVVNSRPVGLLAAGVEVAQRLCSLHMRRRFLEHGEVRFDGVLNAVLLKELLGTVQMLVDVCHSCGLPLWSLECSRCAGGALASLLNYILRKKSGQKLRRNGCEIIHGLRETPLRLAIPAKSFQLT